MLNVWDLDAPELMEWNIFIATSIQNVQNSTAIQLAVLLLEQSMKVLYEVEGRLRVFKGVLKLR